jgi:hypothetical protein
VTDSQVLVKILAALEAIAAKLGAPPLPKKVSTAEELAAWKKLSDARAHVRVSGEGAGDRPSSTTTREKFFGADR